MGTSRNDRSPQTLAWRTALAVLGTSDTPADRQCTEIWRAVAADRGTKLEREFSNAVFAEACRLASAQGPVQEAVRAYNEVVRYVSDAGLAVDMGRRALARSAAEKGGAKAFVSELFAEAVSYYASRDLPSFVGATGRVHSSTECIDLKDSLRQITRERVMSAGDPGASAKSWGQFVGRALRALRKEGARS